ncbi:dnaJ homolog subfamily B member 13 [Diachasma alloeum]|uniref:dnaJ homolog subfamily B member 13 n=1 Tax=Diachasma alloeum TaxID=454923 RepID=UPI0007381B60|nr:dnaJ homolog subfamily B member 13 [Diachasma alloeum]
MCSPFCNAKKCQIDYYGVLGLTRDCIDLDIKKAYRRLAIHYHPVGAKNENFLEVFTLAAEAYEVLSDPLKRAIYNQYGEAGLKSGLPGPHGHIPPYVFHGDPIQTYNEFFGSESPYADLLDFLENKELLERITGGEGVNRKDDDVVIPLELQLIEIFRGALKKKKIERLVFANPEKTFTKMQEKIFTITIDPGLKTGTKIVFPEEGDRNPNTIPADIIFITADTPHETCQRENDDLLMIRDVTLNEALTGTVIKIDTLDARTLRIPITSIITPNYRKVVPGEGLPMMHDPTQRGDLVISFLIEFPMYLSVMSKNNVKEALDARRLKIIPDCT